MERLTRHDVVTSLSAVRFMGAEVKIQDISDKLLHLILNGPTINSINKDTLRHLVRQLYDELYRYEELGRTPEELHELLFCSAGPFHKKMGEWMKAESEGRLIVSPIKPGDIVYWILDDDGPYVSCGDKIIEVGTVGFFVGNNTFDGKHETDDMYFFPFDVLGQHCFRSQEEAEAALAKMKEGSK